MNGARALIAVVAAVAIGCDSSANDASPTTAAGTVDAAIPTATTSGNDSTASTQAECGATIPPTDDQCVLVDWDLITVDGSTILIRAYLNAPGCAETIERVDVYETPDRVRLAALARYTGDGTETCPTALGSTEVSVELAAPLAQRTLVGCRPPGSFALVGGYDDPEPRNNGSCR